MRTRRMIGMGAAGVVVLVAALVTGAGGASAGRAEDRERRAVIEAVDGLFDAMRAKDEAALRAALAPEVSMAAVGLDGGVRIDTGTPDAFVERIVGSEAFLDEAMWDPLVRTDGKIAILWAPYDFLVDGEPSHCGFDAFQLVKMDGAWRIVGVAYTRRDEGCQEIGAFRRPPTPRD